MNSKLTPNRHSSYKIWSWKQKFTQQMNDTHARTKKSMSMTSDHT